MSRHDDATSIRQVRAHAQEAVDMVAGRVREELDSNRMLSLALVRLVEIVGEAASRVSAETRGRYPDVPWSQIVALRNRLIHGYDSIDLDIL
jgi:uncharacterized protein with HEPN domain